MCEALLSPKERFCSLVVEKGKHLIAGKNISILKTQIFHTMKKYDLKGIIRPLLCYWEVALFIKKFNSFDQISTLTDVLKDSFCPYFSLLLYIWHLFSMFTYLSWILVLFFILITKSNLLNFSSKAYKIQYIYKSYWFTKWLFR